MQPSGEANDAEQSRSCLDWTERRYHLAGSPDSVRTSVVISQSFSASVIIRPYEERDATEVRELFIAVNRSLSPPDMRPAFEEYISRSLAEEMDRITLYYGEQLGRVCKRGL